MPDKKIPENSIICGAMPEATKVFPDGYFDAIVTDPPYGLEFMGKEWDKFGISETRAKRLTRTEKSQDAQKYDYLQGKGRYSEMTTQEKRTMQEFFYQWSGEALRVVKPGAFLLCFGGTRTYHRVTCGLEDAGWQIRDCLMWLYGSGFPKSLDISKAIDKAKGVDRPRDVIPNPRSKLHGDRPWMNDPEHRFQSTLPITDLAQLWNGYGTALKPAWEPIIVAMKPLDGTFAQNAETHGVAGLNIDGGRIGTENTQIHRKHIGAKMGTNKIYGESKGQQTTGSVKGRWPANVILDEEAAAMLDEQSGELQSGAKSGVYDGWGHGRDIYGDVKPYLHECKASSGGASRFFYCAKASRSERNAGLKGMEEKRPDDRTDTGKGIWVEKGTAKQTNHHPTVKPLKLMEYLCTLLKPPSEHPILLDPFCGSGTTLMAAFNTGWSYIGIDKEAEYVEIAKKRVAWCKEQKAGQLALWKK